MKISSSDIRIELKHWKLFTRSHLTSTRSTEGKNLWASQHLVVIWGDGIFFFYTRHKRQRRNRHRVMLIYAFIYLFKWQQSGNLHFLPNNLWLEAQKGRRCTNMEKGAELWTLPSTSSLQRFSLPNPRHVVKGPTCNLYSDLLAENKI